jgi:hypothetical protein
LASHAACAENVDEDLADDLCTPGSDTPASAAGTPTCVDVDYRDAEILRERASLVRPVQTQQAVVDEHAVSQSPIAQ